MDLLLKRSLFHISLSSARDASSTTVWRRKGIACPPVPGAGGGLVFWCHADQAIAEWKVEYDDLRGSGKTIGRGTHYELPTDFFKVPRVCGVESSGSSFGDRRR
jgi:hypothetical protein